MNTLMYVYRHSETIATRLWFGLASIGFAAFMLLSNSVSHENGHEYAGMLILADRAIWAILFFIHGSAVLYGAITRFYCNLLLLLEGVLGCAVWVTAAIAMSLTQGTPGAAVSGGLVAIWLLIRYPTHWEYVDES